MGTDEVPQGLRGAFRASGCGVDDLWVRHIGVGGNLAMVEFEACLHELLEPDHLQRATIAQALIENFVDETGVWPPATYP